MTAPMVTNYCRRALSGDASEPCVCGGATCGGAREHGGAPMVTVDWECDDLRAEVETLRRFAQRIMDNWPEGDVDGGELQEVAIECGLLLRADPPPAEPCGDRCWCAEFYGPEEFTRGEVVCYRRTPILTGEVT